MEHDGIKRRRRNRTEREEEEEEEEGRATGRWATRNIGVPLIIKEPFAVAPMPTDVE